GGTTVPLTEERAGEALPQRLLDPVAAWYVANVLSGTPPPAHAPSGRIAFKTGTSYGYPDAWSVRFDRAVTIRVGGGPARRRPAPGRDRPHGGGAYPVRRLRAPGRAAGAAGARAQGRDLRDKRQIAAAAAALPPRRPAGLGSRGAAHPVSAQRLAPR